MPKVIVGLGNPGQEYDNTRHNIGFMVIDVLAKKLGLNWENSKKFKAEIIKIPGLSMSIITNGFITTDTILAKPQTFMNNSGESLRAVLSYYKLLPKKLGLPKTADADLSDILTVIHDDLDIKLGKFKVSVDSRSAGHKGVESIISRLKTKNFKRLRVGIRSPELKNKEAGRFVLKKLNPREKNIIQDLTVKIIEEAL